MTNEDDEFTQWLDQQVTDYKKALPRYEICQRVLHAILSHATKQVSAAGIVTSRVKDPLSAAEKAAGKRLNPSDKEPPFNNILEDMTDLVGGRVMVQMAEDAHEIARLLRGYLFIVQEEDVATRLLPKSFGYTSLHLLVQIDPQKVPENLRLVNATDDKGRAVTSREISDAAGLLVEVQIRTFAQHVTADFGHDRFYKAGFQLPKALQREAARVEAMLEVVDETLASIDRGVSRLHTNVGPFLDKHVAHARIKQIEATRVHNPESMKLVNREARLHMSLGEWDEAKTKIQKFEDVVTKDQWNSDLLSNLGYCQIQLSAPGNTFHQDGIAELKKAIAKNPKHVEALTRLAESVPHGNAAERVEPLEHFSNAYKAADWEPRVVAGYLAHRINCDPDKEIDELALSSVKAAIEISKQRIAISVNLPYAFFHLSVLQLLNRQPIFALESLCRGLTLTKHMTNSVRAIKEVYDRFKLLELGESSKNVIPGVTWCLDVLRIKLAICDSNHLPIYLGNKKTYCKTFKGKVVIVAGGCDPRIEEKIKEDYEKLLAATFKNFTGTILCGGTTQGVSGLIGDLLTTKKHDDLKSGDRRGIGYLPNAPLGSSATQDDRYVNFEMDADPEYQRMQQINWTSPFLPTQPIQSWVDMICAGVKPEDVRLLGIDGGQISRIEFRLAAALGAKVGVIEGSGRAADEIAKTSTAPGNRKIMILPKDAATLNEYVCGYEELFGDNPPELSDMIEHAQKQYYDTKTLIEKDKREKAIRENEYLEAVYRESTRDQINHIKSKLNKINLDVSDASDPRPTHTLTPEEIEQLAEIEHGRWNIERLMKDWVKGDTDSDDYKQRSSLVPWEDLDDEEFKELDRSAVRIIPDLLKMAKPPKKIVEM